MKKIILTSILVFISLIVYNFCVVSSSAPNCKQIIQNKIMNKYPLVNGNIILIDYSKPSCEDRLYIYNIDTESVIYSACVLHGCGAGNTASKANFSNIPGSKCSSIGISTTAELSTMNNGYPCIRLDGLSNTNNNIRKRGICIHPSIMASLLPFEIKGMNFPLTKSSEGCISVSFHTFNKIEKLLKEYDNEKIYILAYT